MPDPDLAASQQFTAEIDTLGAQAFLSDAFLVRMPNTQVRAYRDQVARGLTFSIETAFLKHRIHAEPKETERVPADWWQALKARWFPRGLARVKYREIPTRYELWAVCPHIPFENHGGQQVHFSFLRNDGWEK